MGLKADDSFLHFVTMGAVATQHAMQRLTALGFEPVVLERGSTSNKIWETKVKRLRLADVVCVKTGVRFEIRAKSDLQVKMSDSPSNPERKWDAPLRADDLIAFVPCDSTPAGIVVRGPPSFFRTGDLKASEARSKLGAPKSSQEGAERDRTWPSTIPKKSGTVLSVDSKRIVTTQESGRKQTYPLKGRTAYVRPGDNFTAGVTFLAGVVPQLADITSFTKQQWDPLVDLGSPNPVDRYVAAKAIPFRNGALKVRRHALDVALQQETEARTRLELASSAARLGSQLGRDVLLNAVWKPEPGALAYLAMEAVLILAEIHDSWAADTLEDIAKSPRFSESEIRQAAIWGLGRTGHKAYDRIVQFISDSEDAVVIHAIATFGVDTPAGPIQELVSLLVADPSDRIRASASEALRCIGSQTVADALEAAASSGSSWIPATLGRLTSAVLEGITDTALLAAAAPVRMLAEETNWLMSRATSTEYQFLLKQDR
ncbi:HEAT repeat domain-containing protein [Corallococcus sp. AS-1-6]|uniref:HEAT repeat domain-containing protein n=1 Tax=Corallococcus sp. AS-1-6 TaxID=2874599 RepID=UPI001CBB95A8|nr:HEAT repeat domain-containing protein [Corallococcus sp. AS-1-6]MBZ4373191.1 HEAT repeat domain-containing protein [Corallococcus sp. AS-1-6]